MTYPEWEQTVATIIRADSLWRVEAYRLSLYLFDLAWEDASVLMRDPRTAEIACQLCRAVGKISSNISEGYSRNSGKARAVYYEYAVGSTRESRDWYYKGRHVLGEPTARVRMELTTQIVRLTLTMANNERRSNRRIVSE
jgi:four helix bundle protein